MRRQRAVLAIVGALALLCGQTIGAQSVYEGFALTFPLYNAGTGLSGSWQPLSLDAIYTAGESSLVFPGLRSSPGRVSARASAGLFNGAVRSLTQSLGADNTTAYVSVLLRPQGTLNAGAANGWFGVSLVGALGPELFIGKPGGGALTQYVIENRGGAGQVSSGVPVVIGQTVLLVVKAQFMAGNDTFTLYTNPGLGAPEPVPAVIKNDLDLGTVSEIAIESTGAFDVDEIRIGTTYASVTPRVPDHLLRGGDFDGDLKTEITVYNASSGAWSSLLSAGGYNTVTGASWGGTGYDPVPGDYDGDGKSDYGVYQSSTGNWSILLSSGNFTVGLYKNAGGTGWTPVPGDYDGDGKTDLVVHNAATGQWFGLLSASSYTPAMNVFWGGGSGSIAVPRDFDGDGKTDLGMYQSTTGAWAVALSSTSYATSLSLGVGGPGWMPVAADYDGDGRADFVVYNTTTGLWYGLKSSTGYTAFAVSWGGAGYTPVRGDYDGDGKADLATYVQASGAWYILLSGSNYATVFSKNWGGTEYVPIPRYP